MDVTSAYTGSVSTLTSVFRLLGASLPGVDGRLSERLPGVVRRRSSFTGVVGALLNGLKRIIWLYLVEMFQNVITRFSGTFDKGTLKNHNKIVPTEKVSSHQRHICMLNMPNGPDKK